MISCWKHCWYVVYFIHDIISLTHISLMLLVKEVVCLERRACAKDCSDAFILLPSTSSHTPHSHPTTITSSPSPCHNTSSALLFFIFLPKFVPSAKHSTSTNLNPYSTLSSKRWTKRKTRHSKTTLSISVDKRRYSPQSPEPTISNSPTWYPHNPHPTVP